MPNPPGQRLWIVALVFYGPMLLAAPFVKPHSLLAVGGDPAVLVLQGGALALALGASAAIVIGSRWVSRATGWGRALRGELAALLRGVGSGQILAVALLSAFGEELLFRGVALFYLGLWIQAGLFGLFHFPVRRTLLPWTAFALAMGLGLGELTSWSGALWPAVLLHFCVNYFNLHDLAEAKLPVTPRVSQIPPN